MLNFNKISSMQYSGVACLLRSTENDQKTT